MPEVEDEGGGAVAGLPAMRGSAERTMSAVGVKMVSERLRQRSASSPASSRASGGARVHARVEEEIMTAVSVYL